MNLNYKSRTIAVLTVLLMLFLLNNQILHSSTMSQMLDYVQMEPDSQDGYGLGIQRKYRNNLPEIGHTGGGIGSACQLGHLPHNGTYYFIGIT